jgi:hypothetical protein
LLPIHEISEAKIFEKIINIKTAMVTITILRLCFKSLVIIVEPAIDAVKT